MSETRSLSSADAILGPITENLSLFPDRLAVSAGGHEISYAELDVLANRLARWLGDRGIGPDDVVALCLDRGVTYVVAALAVLKAGAAYLPIDPANPRERIAQIIHTADVGLTLCASEHLGWISGPAAAPDALDLAELDPTAPPCTAGPDHLAYVVYTSGSTGTPKGVMITRSGLASLIEWHCRDFDLGAGDRTTLVASPGFDASVWEIWPTLAAGASLHVPSEETRLAPASMIEWLTERKVTVAFLPTPLAEQAVRLPWPSESALRVLLTGGDRLHVRPPASLPFRLVNNYGPTENSVVSTSGAVGAVLGGMDAEDGVGTEPVLPSIGREVAGTSIVIVGDDLTPVPDGEVGEIYLGGNGLARGYLGRADLTADRFVPDPSRPGGRLYRTGDLGRRLEDGRLEFVGRADEQIKIRGYRIEPGEVAAVIAEHADVAAAYVIAHRQRLVGYVVPADPERLPPASALSTHVADRLPGYMVPTSFILLDALPVNASGKVDRRALPEPDLGNGPRGGRGAAPATATQRSVAGIWQDVLATEAVGLDDDFTELGGHSLLATQITARIKAELGVALPVKAVFAHPTLAGLAAAVEEARSGAAQPSLPPIEPGSGPEVSPLSLQQQQVWFLNKLAPGNAAYHAQATIRILGPLDLDAMTRVLTEITRRHESLRTTYEERSGTPCQVVHPPVQVPLPLHDLSGFSEEERRERRDELVRQELSRPFDLGRLPLARWTALRLGPDDHELILEEHHLVHDGWSFSVLMREMETLYNAFAAGLPSPLPELPVQYRDYIAWQDGLRSSGVIDKQLAYWKDRLAGASGVLSLPTDRPRPKAQSFSGHLLRLHVPAGVPTRIRALCRQEGVSLYMTMLAAFVALMHRYTGDDDICVGSGFANRRLKEAEDLIGMLVNPVVVRSSVTGRTTFRSLLAQAREGVLDGAANQECPLPLVVEALGLDRDPAHNPLVQVMFSAHDSAVRNPELGGAISTVVERHNGSAKMDLNIIVVPRTKNHMGPREHTDDRITLLWEYNADLFDESTMRDMSAAYFRLLAAAVDDPDTAVGDLPLLDGLTRSRLLDDVNPRARHGLSRDTPAVPELVQRWAAKTPDAVAVATDDAEITYGELVRRADAVAAYLRERGIGTERTVALCLPRSIDLIVAELGVMKAGAAFVPIDPENPAERVGYMLAESRARLLITTDDLRRDDLPSVTVAELVEAPASGAAGEPAWPGPGDLAYVVYTSGSTGRPKGVMIQHHGFANLVAWHSTDYEITAGDRTTLVASSGFDFSIWEAWPTLIAGACLCLPDKSTLLDGGELQAWLVRNRINVTLLPTPIAESVLALDWPDAGALRVMHAGGDRLNSPPRSDLGFRLFNTYGPTENTAISTTGEVDPETATGLPDIGRPIPGTAVYLLDGELNLVPPGAVGEIYLGGVGLARGYVRRPELTADRFVPNPYPSRPGERLYRTGDLARYRPDGRIDFLGRADAQVQIRGRRIELAEITATLLRMPGVRDAHTALLGEDLLVGYVVAEPGEEPPAVDAMRDRLAASLPAYMVPAHYVTLDALPLTRNGKVDRRALPRPERESTAEEAPPTTDVEHALTAIWSEVLGIERIGVHDNFFDLGGHSLLLSDVHRKAKARFDRDLPLVALFQHPTISAFARYLEDGASEADLDRRAERRLATRDRLRQARRAYRRGPR